jgi:hypothetical protein
VQVTDLGDGPDGASLGFDVAYRSPAEGALRFSWTGPLTADGAEVPLHGSLRIENPFTRAAVGATRFAVADGPTRLDLDLRSIRRHAEAHHR